MNDKCIYKIMLLGPPATGAKTSLLMRITNNYFQEDTLSTMGLDYKFISHQTKYGIVKFQIWDTAGQARFRAIQKNYYRGCHCFVLGYDITKKNSFDEIKNEFYNYIITEENPIKNPLICLVANKIDNQDNIQVLDEEAISFANDKKIPYFKVSAKTGEGVDILKNYIFNAIIEKFPSIDNKQNKTIKSNDKKKKNLMTNIKQYKTTTSNDKKEKNVNNVSLKVSNKKYKHKFLLLNKYYNY